MIDLNAEYDRSLLRDLLKTFLPNDLEFFNEPKDIRLNDNFKKIKNAHILAEVPSLELTIFELHHSSPTDPRVEVSKDAFRILAESFKHRALVAIKNHNSPQWRLSLMIIDLNMDKKERIKHIYSNPRRYSYILGLGSKIVTPGKYLLNQNLVKSFEDLKKRFAPEVVNNEFYKQIAGLYDELVGTESTTKLLKYPGSDEESHEFAVRLIGRIIFCWFLREKKSNNGIALIPNNLLSVDAANVMNYYHSILAPLFFEVLNKDPEKRSPKFKENGFQRIPYLNGGLFNNDEIDHYKFDKDLEVSIPGIIEVPDSWLKKLFGLLELYNFTVDENTSYDIDLSIDPEMLGRVFENLLARISPETGETVRKSTGSFYMPREIVDYMVDAGLTKYLLTKTKVSRTKIKALVSYDLEDDIGNELSREEGGEVLEALSALTVLDPACGSGAFPIGVLQKILHIISILDTDATWWKAKQLASASPELRREFDNKGVDYIRKLGIIRQTIFGVDIQPIATEISRLRCFLTLIVDEEIDDKAWNRGIRPLPNLDFKFVTANSLVPLPKSEQSALFEESSHIDDLRKLRNEYFTSTNHERAELQAKFSDLQKKMILKNIDEFSGQASDLYNQLSRWDPFETQASGWFDPEWMFGVDGGFDLVIGNPPYFVYQGHNKNEIPLIKKIPLYDKAQGGKLNAYKLFLALAPSLLKHSGITSFIFQNSFLADNSAKKIRQHYLNSQQILIIDSFPERDNVQKRVFESVKMSVCIMLAKNELPDGAAFTLNIWADKYRSEGNTTTFTPNELTIYDPVSTSIPYLLEKEKKIFSKCFKATNKGAISCYEGELNMTFHRSYFTQDVKKPKVIKGAQVQRYKLVDNLSQGVLEYINDQAYLADFGTSNKSRHHEENRIAMQGITGVDDGRRFVMAIVPAGLYCANSCNYIHINDSKYSEHLILALFNSYLFNWIFKKTSTNSNVNCYEVENMPVPKLNSSNEEIAVMIINKAKLIHSGVHNQQEIESEIDRLVYQLYDLTPEEIKIIESSK